MQNNDERTITVPRTMISGMMLGPLVPGFMVILKSIDDPLLRGVRGPVVLRLISIGFAVGVSFCGLMLFIKSKEKRS